ncbi:MAG: electron transfer flavoprotein subunit beta/FixA family protein [Planctomycetota bacterium]|nr:MAG: electron transfer flavoprotein subunit beta/FixA family protein [Planctomycetota bacterium]REK25275.1 MAG: electron transfer flavoprotein subunit beta/FixA family protein [Planctomycetota bacterium]REK49498.1 MAG: electron transfer flavoprotein subunit beta/FixA family protein [Planctomycetota bacterium]
MKILVPTKRVPDTELKIRLTADGSGVDEAQLSYIVNPFDAIALEEAIRMREGAHPDAEIIVVGIGGADYEKQLRTGLAMGADRALHVGSEESLDPWNAAQLLLAVVRRESPDLVLLGKQAVDDDANQTGQFLAALLDWPQATFASKIEFAEDAVRVDRETDLGIETVQVRLPAVITADLRLNEPRYASLPSIMKARKKPIEEISAADLGVTLEPRVRVVGFEIASAERTCRKVATADELIECLRNEAKVL